MDSMTSSQGPSENLILKAVVPECGDVVVGDIIYRPPSKPVTEFLLYGCDTSITE